MANAKRPGAAKPKGNALASNTTPMVPPKPSKFQMPAARKSLGGGKRKG